MDINTFINYLKLEKRYSPHTLLAYKNDLQQFSEYLIAQGENALIHQISYMQIRTWLVQLMQDKMDARSVKRKISTLKTYYKWLLKEGFITNNPMKKIISPKSTSKLPVFVDEKKMNTDDIFDIESLSEYEHIRNITIVEIFYQTGIRLSELTNLRSTDIDITNCCIKVLGKRNKERIIPFGLNLKKLLAEYTNIKEKELKENENHPYFFSTKNGKKIYPKLVYRIVNYYLSHVATISKKSPHVLRHTFATHLLNNGADINAIKEILGHSSLAATQVYTHNTIEKLKKIYQQAHPMA